MTDSAPLEKATFGAGCFWCIESIFNRIQGVVKAESGYSGGHTASPTYESVCGGGTGHVEVVQITFDPTLIRFDTLLDMLFELHDPTTLNRQGNDVGDQYRSVIFYHDEAQAAAAREKIRTLTEQKAFARPIVTAVEPLRNYFPAEDYHQGYFEENPHQPYCAFVVGPKVEKALKRYKDRLKP